MSPVLHALICVCVCVSVCYFSIQFYHIYIYILRSVGTEVATFFTLKRQLPIFFLLAIFQKCIDISYLLSFPPPFSLSIRIYVIFISFLILAKFHDRLGIIFCDYFSVFKEKSLFLNLKYLNMSERLY